MTGPRSFLRDALGRAVAACRPDLALPAHLPPPTGRTEVGARSAIAKLEGASEGAEVVPLKRKRDAGRG